MHQKSYELMADVVEEYMKRGTPTRILDVGAQDVNGTYKPLFRDPAWEYVGSDVEAGLNVDVVLPLRGEWPIEAQSFDVVISGQCLEHCEFPWKVAAQIARATRLMGLVVLIAPWKHGYHPYPIDCWRILPDGIRAVMEEDLGFKTIRCERVGADTIYIGSKRRMGE